MPVRERITFQDVILRLHEFWAGHNCVIWQPYNIQVGAGTMNPATYLRVLGPEPWNVAYVEPSVRPDDGRYGDNPNRMQYFYQYQVILKPDPGNPQELYLQSLAALGIDLRRHDVRFVEDNWESPALGAWGLGWEVWLDGQEITQFTYFQQAGGQTLNPVSVEITYGLERILLPLQHKSAVWDINWVGNVSYGDVLLQSEIEHCRYYFEVADVPALAQVFNIYEAEAERALAQKPPLVMPAHDYVLKCSHLFNVLDARGAVGVVERADYFRRMQRLAAQVARAYASRRSELGYPDLPAGWRVDPESGALNIPAPQPPALEIGPYPQKPASFLLEIGVEELPAGDLASALEQLRELVPGWLAEARLEYSAVTVGGTPRRLVVLIDNLSPSQQAQEIIQRGPPVRAAFDAEGRPTRAAEGFARGQGVSVEALERRIIEGGEYVVAVVKDAGRPAPEVLSERLPGLLAALRFDKVMRWNASSVTFSRPIRWLVALYDSEVIPFEYGHVFAGRTTRGSRAQGAPAIDLASVADYLPAVEQQGILVDPGARREAIAAQIAAAARRVGGQVLEDPDLLDQVTHLVEQPTALLGSFDKSYLQLPGPVLTTVMKKHQRYFAVVDRRGDLLPYFIAVRNGGKKYLNSVIAGNEHVIQARFADARFFYDQDIQKPLAAYLDGLKMLTFQEQLGSYYDKVARLEGLTGRLGSMLGMNDEALESAIRAARLAKADLATQIVVEMTSLQGIMGCEYARASGEPESVATAIAEHYQPRYSGDALPGTPAGIAVALADRLDSLVGLFNVGLEPTGSADPFGLRRAALGVVQILIGRGIHLDLRQAIQWAAMGYTRELGAQFITDEARASALAFVTGRLRVALREQFAHDVVEAVLNAVAFDPLRAAEHARQLSAWVQRPDWSATLDAYARCMRITRSEVAQYAIQPNLFTEPAEKSLFEAYQTAARSVGPEPDVDTLLTAFLPMVPAITTFFAPAAEGGVLVMHKDRAIRENRLALLQAIAQMATGVADLSQMEGF